MIAINSEFSLEPLQMLICPNYNKNAKIPQIRSPNLRILHATPPPLSSHLHLRPHKLGQNLNMDTHTIARDDPILMTQ